VHDGGKDQVSINLLRGFEKIGLSEELVVFCIPEMEEYVCALIPKALVVPVAARKMWKKTIRDIWTRTLLFQTLIKRHDIGVLLFPMSNTGLRRFGIPTVVVPHDIQTQTHKGRFPLRTRALAAFFYHFDFRLRDWIIAISGFDQKELEETYPAYTSKIVQIYNPIRADIFMATEGYKADRPYITAINIQHHHKNVITLIKAFEILKDQIPHDLYLIGRIKPETAFLSVYVKEHDLSDRVKFLGFVEDEKLACILKGSALYVNPSLFEGFGMTAVEAMLSEVPTLTTLLSAVPEVTMGLCHYYEPAEDSEALAATISSILIGEQGKPADALKLIAEKLKNRYDYANIARQYYDFLQSLKTGEK
jgi:glycosyltransferase involved in cell wall biosynthesis